MGQYDWVTDEMFDDKFFEILSGITADDLILRIPDIHSDVREFFNNQVLTELEEEREQD